jgi:hypothetical protein
MTIRSVAALRHALAEGLRLELASEPGRQLSETEASDALAREAEIVVVADADQLRELRAIELRVLDGRKAALLTVIRDHAMTLDDESEQVVKARADLAVVRHLIRSMS